MEDLHKLHFTKYQGIGNDFIIIDNRQSNLPLLTSQQCIKLCNRHFGIGADGVIFAMSGINNCDFTMRIYNSDGSEPQMCGNGIRCLAKYLHRRDDINKSSECRSYRIWTNAGVITLHNQSNGQVRVDMGSPILQPDKIPTTLTATQDNMAVNAPCEALGHTYKVTAVSMGNPHAVR